MYLLAWDEQCLVLSKDWDTQTHSNFMHILDTMNNALYWVRIETSLPAAVCTFQFGMNNALYWVRIETLFIKEDFSFIIAKLNNSVLKNSFIFVFFVPFVVKKHDQEPQLWPFKVWFAERYMLIPDQIRLSLSLPTTSPRIVAVRK